MHSIARHHTVVSCESLKCGLRAGHGQRVQRVMGRPSGQLRTAVAERHAGKGNSQPATQCGSDACAALEEKKFVVRVVGS